ncbi:MAG: hypothetical protein V1912_11195 [bacterium]
MNGLVVPGPGASETGRLEEGLANLPVHAQMTEDAAQALVEFLNRI